jgi:hypothetical protein
MNVLAQEDAQASRQEEDGGDAKTRQQLESWRLPNYSQAMELLKQHKSQLSVAGLHLVDYVAVEAAFDVNTEAIRRDTKYDVIALMLFLCASALSAMPATYSITIGLVCSSEEIVDLGDTWVNAAWTALDHSDQYTSPTMEGVQAIVTYQYNLADRGSRYRMVNSLDQGIRACRQLGLDRLGSYESDEQIWAKEASFHTEEALASDSQQRFTGWWAAKTLKMRDWKAREFARCQWVLLMARDWAASRQLGSYSIHPGSFTTQPPKIYVHKSAFDTEGEQVWPYLLEGAKVLRKFGDLCADVDTHSTNGTLKYEDILSLDAQIVTLLERRPAWMRAEDDASDMSGTVLTDAAGTTTASPSIVAFLSCALWQRLYVIVSGMEASMVCS